MSYLVDALKKAERERHQHARADMESLSSEAPNHARRGGSSLLRWVVTVLIACNLVLVGYLLLPKDRAPVVEPDAQAQAAGKSAPEADSQATVDTPAADAQSPDRTFGRLAGDQPAPRSSSRVRSGEAPEDLRFANAPAARSQPAPRAPRGQVTYAREPLDDSAAAPSASGGGRAPDRGAAGDVPQVTINGHLYSSVPGRSFILVNGHRYHEGERLASGPSVESIDPRGATLNYQGQRYHVAGPG